MPTFEHTRKPIDALTIEDLEAFPVWEFATDEEGVEGQDETWVRPLPCEVIPLNAYSLSVHADFLSASELQFQGIIEVSTEWNDPVPAASLIVDGAYIYLDGAPGSRERARIAKRLGGTDAELFPFTYKLRVLVEGESAPRTGRVE
jgi:hypothetical protein